MGGGAPQHLGACMLAWPRARVARHLNHATEACHRRAIHAVQRMGLVGVHARAGGRLQGSDSVGGHAGPLVLKEVCRLL